MKRDRRLRDLSDDHHQALVLARRATRAADDATAPVEVWNEVVRRFEHELAPHFALEEQYLLPALERSGHADLAKRTRDEHAELRALICDHQRDVTSKLARFGALLRDHVRFEERVLFVVIQETFSDELLDAAAAAYGKR